MVVNTDQNMIPLTPIPMDSYPDLPHSDRKGDSYSPFNSRGKPYNGVIGPRTEHYHSAMPSVQKGPLPGGQGGSVMGTTPKGKGAVPQVMGDC